MDPRMLQKLQVQLESRNSLPEMLAVQVRDMILSGQLKPGEKLPSERDLAIQLGVGRNSVREMVRLLSTLGFLEIRHGSGVYVREPNLQPLVGSMAQHLLASDPQVSELVDARRAVESEIAGLAAAWATEDALATVEEYLQQQETEQGLKGVSGRHDLIFESLLAQAAGNKLLATLQHLLHEMWGEYWNRIGYIPRGAERRLGQHKEILALIKARDVEGARAAMRQHISLPQDDAGPAG